MMKHLFIRISIRFIRILEKLCSFKSRLKTHYFQLAFNNLLVYE